MSTPPSPPPPPPPDPPRRGLVQRGREAHQAALAAHAAALADGDPAAVARDLAKQKIGSMIAMHVRREVKTVASVLQEGERIVTLAGGEYGGGHGLVVATDRRVLFYKHGFVSATKVVDFPYSRIGSVEAKKGMIWGKVTIHASGNDAVIEKIDPASSAVELADAVRAELARRESAPAAATPAPPPADPHERLRALTALHTDGLLTDEEFAQKRAALIAEL